MTSRNGDKRSPAIRAVVCPGGTANPGPHEIESIIRSAAMAPPDSGTVRQVLKDYRALLRERAELEEFLSRLRPAWGGAGGVERSGAEGGLSDFQAVVSPRPS